MWIHSVNCRLFIKTWHFKWYNTKFQVNIILLSFEFFIKFLPMFQKGIIIHCIYLAKQGENALGSVSPCVCPFACALKTKAFDLQLLYSVCRLTLTVVRFGL